MKMEQDTYLSFGNAINLYLDFLTGVRRASPHTIKAYATDLRQFEQWMQEQNPVATTRDSTPNMVTAYVLQLKSSGYSTATQARKVAAIKGVYKFCRAMEYYHQDESEHISRPRVTNTLPRVLSVESIQELIEATAHASEPFRSRDRAMLETLYATGLRISELLGLNIRDIDFEDQLLRCSGKGNRERIVPLHDEATTNLQGYILTARAQLRKSDAEAAVFLNRFGKRLTRQGFWQIIKAYAAKAGISGYISPHVLRHSFATHMIEGGAPISYVQTMLGHSSVSTTEVYNHVANDYLREEFEAAHPRARSTR